MLTVLKVLGILVGIKLTFDILRFAIIEIYYAHRGWTSGICIYGIDKEGNILTNIPNRLVKLLMDSRRVEYTVGYNFGDWCARLIHGKGKA